MSPSDHYRNLQDVWFNAYTQSLACLAQMSGDESRAVGQIVQEIIDAGPGKNDWRDTGAALFLRNDPKLWHELANSRKI